MVKDSPAKKSDIKRVEDKTDSLKEALLEFKVEILTEIKNLREDFDAHQFSHMRINDELEEHDNRLKKLEISKI